MNIFHKIALTGLKKNRTRTLVTIIGVILSSVMITGVITFGVSLLDYMARGAISKYGAWGAAFLDVDASYVQERMQDEEVADTAVFENIGYAPLEGGENPEKPYFFIAGFSQDTFAALPVTLISGRLPENDGEVIISARVALDSGRNYQPGDTISLLVGSRRKGEQELTQADPYSAGEETYVPREEKTYTVVGTCRTPVFETENSPGYVLITKSDPAGSANSLSLFVTMKTPYKIYSYVEEKGGEHAHIFNYDVLRIMGISNQTNDRVFLLFLYSFGGIVLAIIMTGSIFLIYNSFSISLSERIREIGVLASVGATPRQLRDSVLFEGICIGIAGIPIGILAGLGGIYLVLSTVSSNFESILYSGVSLTMKVSAPALGGAVAVSLVTVLLSAWLPAKKAIRLPVMECIRQTNEIRIESKAVKISQRKQRIYGLEGTLALKNFKRNRKRYRSIVLSLILSIVLFISTNALIGTMRQTTEGFKTVSDYDVGFGAQDIDDDVLFQLYEKLKNVEGVQESSCREMIAAFCVVPGTELSAAYWETMGAVPSADIQSLPMHIFFFDDDFYQKLVQQYGVPAEENIGQNGTYIAVAKINDDSDAVKGASDLADLFQNASVDMGVAPSVNKETGPSTEVNVTMLEVVPPDIPPVMTSTGEETLPYTFEILAPWSAKERFVPSGISADVRSKGMCFDSENPSQSTKEMREIIQEEGLQVSYYLLNSAEAFEQYKNYIFIANVFAYVFIALISLIAVANVFNTISTNIRLRRRELAMLRSVGMSDQNFNKMMRFECALYGMKALAIGIPLALVVSTLIVNMMMTDEATFTLPWLSVGISILSVFLVVFVTMMYAVSKIRKENIIDALRDEMT